MKTCCFIGHRKIVVTEKLVRAITNILKSLIINEDVRVFAFGSRSDFNALCYDIVTNLQKEFEVERVFMTCRSECCYLESEKAEDEKAFSEVLKQDFHLRTYEREVEHKTKYTSGKAAYIERNQALIDMSDFCVFYYDENYKPPLRKHSRKSLVPYQPKSGTACAYKYALQKRKNIINVFCEI